MKTKLLILFLLIAGSCFGQYEKYDKFLINGKYYAFIEAPSSFLDTKIPKEAKWALKADKSQRKFKNFVWGHMTVDLGDTILVMISAKPAKGGRKEGVTAPELATWETYLEAFGFTFDQWLTHDEYLAKIPEGYYDEE